MFVFHTDPRARSSDHNDYWGGESIGAWLERAGLGAAGERNGLEDSPMGHRVGLLRVRPDADSTRQLRRFIDLIFLYGPPSNRHCSRCLTELRIGEDIRFGPKPTKHDEETLIRWAQSGVYKMTSALYHLCPGCGHRWVENHCFHEGHRLIKLGSMSFHRPSRHG